MKNGFEIRREVTAIFLRRKTGEVLETLISTSDLPIAQSWRGTWHAAWDKKSRTFYVRTRDALANRTIKLHRLLLNVPDGIETDHFDHDGLNNQRSNLRATTTAINQFNRKGPSRLSSSGYRGVFKSDDHWVVSCHFRGKRNYLGYFPTIEAAAAVASDFYSKHL